MAPKDLDSIIDGSKARFSNIQDWASIYGQFEYKTYSENHKDPSSYEDWLQSQHARGAYLWHATLDVWDETTTDEDTSDMEVPKAVSPKKQMPVRPKKATTTNGNGMKAKAKPPTSTPVAKPDERADSAKRKRKPKKPYLSEEIIASDDSDDIAEPPPAIQIAAPAPIARTATAVAAATKGRRKSGGRKKKQFLSEETISPLDEADEPISIDAVASAPTPPTSAAISQHKTSVAKSKTKKPRRGKETVAVEEDELPQKSRYRNETLSDSSLEGWKDPEEIRLHKTTDSVNSYATETRRVWKYPNAYDERVLNDEEDLNGSNSSSSSGVATPKNASVVSPHGPGSSSRRGLRARTAAQQNPYQHDKAFESLIFDERVSDPEPGPVRNLTAEPSPKGAATKQVQIASQLEAAQTEAESEDESIMIDEDMASEEQHPRKSSKVHYKGKGRAWKKTESDEDDDFRTGKPKKSGPNAKKNVGGRRKSATVSEPREEEVGPSQGTTPQPKPRKEPKAKKMTPASANGEENKKRKPRGPNKKTKKQKISAEFVQSDTDTEIDDGQQKLTWVEDTATVTPFAPPKRGRGRPRKSEQSALSKTPTAVDTEALKKPEIVVEVDASEKTEPTVVTEAPKESMEVDPSNDKMDVSPVAD